MGTTSVKAARSEAVRTIQVPVQELTPEAFAPFGEVSRPGNGFSPDLAGGKLATCHVQVRRPADDLRFLARHKLSSQVYAPMGAGLSILVVAPPASDDPDAPRIDAGRIAAFRVDGSHAVRLHRGTWHRAPMPVGDSADFLVIDREGTLEDIELADVVDELGVRIEIVP